MQAAELCPRATGPQLGPNSQPGPKSQWSDMGPKSRANGAHLETMGPPYDEAPLA